MTTTRGDSRGDLVGVVGRVEPDVEVLDRRCSGPGDTPPRVGVVTIKICVAGATGWTGRAVAQGVLDAPDLTLVSAVSRSAAGTDLGEAWGGSANGVPVLADVADALDEADVLIEYTSPDAVAGLVRAATSRGVGVVIGSSGLSEQELDELGAEATASGVGIIASGNFSITGAVLSMAALQAAQLIDRWEVLDYASATKPDAPSGTARELAERLSAVRTPRSDVAVSDTIGPVETRGATVGQTQVHSIRLPSFLLSTEVVFALPDERVTIRFDAGQSPEPYVGGTLLAARAVTGRVGLTRGLDTLLAEGMR